MDKITKILINASNLKKGGALQVAHSFLTEIKEFSHFTFYVVLSQCLSEQINRKEYGENFVFYKYTIKTNIVKALNGKDSFLSQLERDVKPNCVFTIFGPAYWKPRSFHILGFADGWCYNPKTIAYKTLSTLLMLKTKLHCKIKNYRMSSEAKIIWVETEDAKKKVSKALRFDSNKIKVIGNTYNNAFNNSNYPNKELPPKSTNEYRFVTVSAYYPHKNLKIIKKVLPLLLNNSINATFILTISGMDYRRYFRGYEKNILNVGPIDIKYVPSLYDQCDALFLPTLLETFSASYLEAMVMGKPIFTSNLDFAKDICGDSAVYFDPLDPGDIAESIISNILTPGNIDLLVKNGYDRLKKYESSQSRALKLLNLCIERS